MRQVRYAKICQARGHQGGPEALGALTAPMGIPPQEQSDMVPPLRIGLGMNCRG